MGDNEAPCAVLAGSDSRGRTRAACQDWRVTAAINELVGRLPQLHHSVKLGLVCTIGSRLKRYDGKFKACLFTALLKARPA